MKNHVTVKITRTLLEEIAACPEGIKEIERFLPLTISTDPEANFAPAALVAQSKRASEEWVDANWLYWALTRDQPDARCDTCAHADYYPDDGYGSRSYDDRNEAEDVFITMQTLAMIADLLATREGR